MKSGLFILLLFCGFFCFGQLAKPVYHPCLLLDSVEAKLSFIQLNAWRVFTDTADCKEDLLGKIGSLYISSKDKKYLDALSAIRQNQSAKVEELYTDLIKRIIENDFEGFVNNLYLSKGKFLSLEKELVLTMNMIVGAEPLKQKYMGRLNIEIEKATDRKDTYKASYLKKLKTRIEEERH
jgi:hypothetical protein